MDYIDLKMYDYSFRTLRKRKIILLGSYGVGKTSLINRYIHNSFNYNYHTTIGVNIQTKLIDHENYRYSLVIWDIAGGQQKYAVPFSYLIMSAGALYVYDITRAASYENIQMELLAIKKKINDAPIIVVANKVDLVSKEELEDHKRLMKDITHIYTSAKDDVNVEPAFAELVSQIMLVESQR